MKFVRQFLSWLNSFSDSWEYGTCNNLIARRHKRKQNVQMLLWRKGQHGHAKDYWTDFDKSHWNKFMRRIESIKWSHPALGDGETKGVTLE